jgi:putative ABC transport system substrate-binding protein
LAHAEACADQVRQWQVGSNLPAIFNLRVFVKSGGLVSYSINPTDLFHRAALGTFEDAINIRAEIEQAIATFGPGVNGGLVVLVDFITLTHRDLIVTLAAHHHLPAIFNLRVFVKSGGLVSYSINPTDLFHRAASYVDRILKGAKAADLPVQQPTKFELHVNLKTAKALGLEVPQTLLATADEVIE